MTVRSAVERRSRSLLLPLVVIAFVIIALGLCKVSGSSVALQDEADPSAEAFGEPRPIRTDEWVIRTPLVVRQATLDFPRSTVMGIGSHDTGVLTDLPVLSPSAVIKPHSWPYFVLDVERAFAIEWWLTVCGPLIGVFAVVVMLTRSRTIAVLSGVLAAASPVAGWWTIPSMGFSVMYGGLTAALLIGAIRRTGWKRYACAAVAGWTAAAFASVLYLPWLIPLALLFAAIVLTEAVGSLRGRRPWLSVFGTVAGVFGVLIAIYLREHRVAIEAISGSVYPGDRVNPSGEARPVLLFGAPFDVFSASRRFADVSGTNQSEAASGLMLWLPIAVIGGAFAGFSSRSAARRGLTAVMIVAMAVAAWALLPVPAILGSLTGLGNVQGSRTALPLTVAGAIAAGLYVHSVREDAALRPQRDRVLIATIVFAFVTGWASTQYTVGSTNPSRSEVLLVLAAVAIVTAALLFGSVRIGLGGAAALLLFGFVRINPVQVGLDPVTDSPLMEQIDAIRQSDADGRWATLGPTGPPKSIVAASGVTAVNGTSWYADPAAWHLIDPTDAYERVWNRYANVSFEIDDAVPDTRIELPFADVITIYTPSCDGALQAFDTSYVVADVETTSPCLQLLDAADEPGERWIYAVTAPPAG